MFNNDGKTKKNEVAVDIGLANGKMIECCFFAAQGQRLLDLMNDDRAYIPYSDTNGKVTIVQKSAIIQITPVDQEPVEDKNAPGWIGN